MAYEYLNTFIKHKTPIPQGYSGRLADIGLDVTKILSDEPYYYDENQLTAVLKNLPILHYAQSKFFYILTSILLVIVEILFGYWLVLLGIRVVDKPPLIIFCLLIGVLFVVILFDELPKRLQGYDSQIGAKIYQNCLKIRANNAIGYQTVEFKTIYLKDIYAVAYEYIPAGQQSYWAVNVYYLTYSSDKVFYKKNVIEIMASKYKNKAKKQFAITLYQLWQQYWQDKDKSKLPTIIYIKQKTFDDFANHQAGQYNNHKNWDNDDWKENW